MKGPKGPGSAASLRVSLAEKHVPNQEPVVESPNTIEKMVSVLSSQDAQRVLDAQNKIRETIRCGGDKRNECLESFEFAMSAALQEGMLLTPDLMLFLSETAHAAEVSLFGRRLTLSVYSSQLAPGFSDEISRLEQSEDSSAIVKLHKLIDAYQTLQASFLDINPDDPEWQDSRLSRGPLQDVMDAKLSSVVRMQQNYLLREHARESFEGADLYGDSGTTVKKGGMSGTPGGMQDSFIFSHEVLQASNTLRRQLGVWEGYPVAQELVPLAPGYVGFYSHGRLEKVYAAPIEVVNTDKEDQALVAQNNTTHDWIYGSLNRPLSPYARSSLGLNKLRDYWNLIKQLGDEQFYFDLDRIDLGALHPMVRTTILEHNAYILQRLHSLDPKPAPVSEAEVDEKLFLGDATDDRKYLYKYFSSYGMRRKVENDFGVSIASLHFAEQMEFMDLLNSADTENFAQYQEFCSLYGVDALRTFLVTNKDSVLRDKVFEFARATTPEQARAVFAAYGSLVESIDHMGEYLRESFGAQDTGAVGAVVERQLNRARKLLADAHTYKDEPERLVALAQSVQADIALFTDACRVLKTRNQLSLEQVRDGTLESVNAAQLQEVDCTNMRDIWEYRYAGKYGAELEHELRTQFEKALASEQTTFYIYRYKGQIACYFSAEHIGISEDELPKKHLASFLTSQSFEGGMLGQAVMEQGIDQEQKGSVLVAESDVDIARTPIVSKYFEDYNFYATHRFEDQGEPTLALERREGDLFATKHLSKKDVQARAHHGESSMLAQFVESDTVPNFDHYLQRNMVLTRYFVAKDAQGAQKYYAVFERLSLSPALALAA